MLIRICLTTLFGLVLVATTPLAAADKPVPGQKPLILVNGVFRFVHGSWATYTIQNLANKESYRMRIAVLEQKLKKKKGKKIPYSWMEIEVEMPEQPSVVTRILTQETPEGPGELETVIVQVKGMDAFSVPKRFFKEKPNAPKPPVAQFRPARQVKQLVKKRYTHRGKIFQAWSLEAVDDSGKPMRAVVSEELAPIGVYQAQSGDTRMELVDWGDGAQTRIRGTVYPFWLWLAGEVSKASQTDKAGK